MSSFIFERHEVKYLVSDPQRRALIQAMGERMKPDEHGESTICNVYYDTPDFRLIRRSLEGPIYKEKLRIRSYGPAQVGQNIFLELKKKYRGVVYKRRITVPLETAEAFLKGDRALPEDCQIGREIAYFLQFYAGLAPAMHISYDRSAYLAKDDPGLRVTFDRSIRWRTEGLSLTARPGGAELLETGQSLMEIKSGEAVPLWLVQLLNQGQIRPTSFSKYGRAYCALHTHPSAEFGGVICA